MASRYLTGLPALIVLTIFPVCISTQPESRKDDTVQMDNRTWSRRTTKQPEIVYSKMVPSNQAFHAWDERIEIATIPVSISDDTINSFQLRRKYELFKDCPTGRWNVLEYETDLVIYEFEHQKCDPYEHRLVVMQRKENRGILFVYRSRKYLGEEQLKHWIEIGKKAHLWNR
ncbi:MAG: hypothetical protein RH862_11050 [Leptospiraceae bacterium]